MTHQHLLRTAGAALLEAGVRLDIVREIERETGAPFPVRVRERVDLAESMRAVAAAIEKAGRPLLAVELGPLVWPGRAVWQVRGYLSQFVAHGWLVHGKAPAGARQAKAYRLGRSQGWTAAPAVSEEAERLRREVEELRRRVAELTAAAAAGGAP